MKSTEILQALKLPKSKDTGNYCSKLASLFTFIKLVGNDLVNAKIVGKNFTIDHCGELLTVAEVDKQYKGTRLNHYKYNHKDITDKTKKESELRSELYKVNNLLWKKRKNKNNSQLESEKEQLTADLKTVEETKETLINAEEIRLQGIETDISAMREELTLFEGCKVTIETKTTAWYERETIGSYSFYLPVNNAFYHHFLSLIGIETTKEEKEVSEVKPLQTILVDSSIFKSLDKAIKFVSNDDLRPVMQHICLAFENNAAEVVATDAHRLYQSAKVESSEKNRIEIMISVKDAKEISKMTFYPYETAEIHILPAGEIMIEGKTFSTFTDKPFVDYRCVIPEYKNYMTFNRADMIANIKTVMPYSNKSTSQVNFFINGYIELSAQDVDFSFESNSRMAYINKNFEDTTIAFNGRFLTDSLAIFKDETVKMFSDGQPTKCAIFTNDIDSVILMPLMLN